MRPFLAYIDPGTGSMLLQGIIAAVASVTVAIGVYRKKIVAFFKKGRNNE